MLAELAMAARFARDLGGFLRQPMTLEEARLRLTHSLNTRSDSFLRIVEHGMFKQPNSPYAALMRLAGVELKHVRGWVAAGGVEAALNQLYAAGVYVTIDEFKGRKPIQRPGLTLPTHDKDFDNPSMTTHLQSRTGGSTSATGKNVNIDLELHTHETAHDLVFLEAFDLFDRPMALWRPAPPGTAGLNIAMRRSKLARPAARWFSQTPVQLGRDDLKFRLFLWLAIYGSRFYGRPIPQPEYVPLVQAIVIARWLAEQKARGTPAVLDTNVGSGIRVCLAAREAGLDIAGTLFRFGSEPYTEARARIVAEVGCKAVCHYFMSEIARVGAACAAGAALDDVHILLDKLAVIQKDRQVGSGETVGALYMTTLHPSTGKLMLNVEVGDYGVLSERDCGCPLGQLGLGLHLHSIRSFEKLTSEGMNFLGSELLALIEDVLPARFGGAPTDYQIVETEANGIAKVLLLVSPRLGTIDEGRVVETALEALAAYGGGKRMMADYWRQGGTLRVLRRDPFVTASAKIPPLYRARDLDLTKD